MKHFAAYGKNYLSLNKCLSQKFFFIASLRPQRECWVEGQLMVCFGFQIISWPIWGKYQLSNRYTYQNCLSCTNFRLEQPEASSLPQASWHFSFHLRLTGFWIRHPSALRKRNKQISMLMTISFAENVQSLQIWEAIKPFLEKIRKICLQFWNEYISKYKQCISKIWCHKHIKT